MEHTMNYRLKLFFTGFLHVLLVAVSTYCISHRFLIGVFVLGFGISWTVRRCGLVRQRQESSHR